jgi:hypothetical protein
VSEQQCLYCEKPLSFLTRLTGDREFCSKEHRRLYQEQHSGLALARLLENKPGSGSSSKPVKSEKKSSAPASQEAADQSTAEQGAAGQDVFPAAPPSNAEEKHKHAPLAPAAPQAAKPVERPPREKSEVKPSEIKPEVKPAAKAAESAPSPAVEKPSPAKVRAEEKEPEPKPDTKPEPDAKPEAKPAPPGSRLAAPPLAAWITIALKPQGAPSTELEGKTLPGNGEKWPPLGKIGAGAQAGRLRSPVFASPSAFLRRKVNLAKPGEIFDRAGRSLAVSDAAQPPLTGYLQNRLLRASRAERPSN